MASSPWIRHVHAADGIQVWIIETAHTAYAFGLDTEGVLQHLYWGAKLSQESEYGIPAPHPIWHQGKVKRELPLWGGIDDTEPCLKLIFADGVRSSTLLYDSFTVTDTRLTLSLRDPHYGLTVKLHYQIFHELDILERKLELVNTGDADITLERAFSANWHFPPRDHYRLTHLAGRWIGEFQIQEQPLSLGKTVLESLTGFTGYAANPFFAMLADDANETTGEVWFGALAYSGNWQMILEKTAHDRAALCGGVSGFDFAWTLTPGETFTTPPFVAGFTERGLGEASRLLHTFERRFVLPPAFADTPRPILYNSWYVTLFEVNTQGQMAAADHAADLGLELFVVDDGWFKGRKRDTAGLGDWVVDRDKFPNGLGPLIEHVKSLGMDFGIWIEPEMVNPDSDLYRAHPDWVYHFPTRERSEVRQQLVLNFAREDVRDFISGAIDTLLSENDIRFLKMDMNRPFSEVGWPGAEAGREREMWLRHTQGLYSVLGKLREKHPHVLIESCAGGGGRVDLGILRYTDQFWLSDNADAFDVLRIQEGSSLAYTPKARMTWVIDPPERTLPLRYRFHVAMTGTMGLGADLNTWSQAERDEAKGYIALYKEIRDTVQHGKLYRLRSPRKFDIAALQFVSEKGDEAVVFAFLHSAHYGVSRCTLRLQGLEPERLYALHDATAPDSTVSDDTTPDNTVHDPSTDTQTLSGEALMKRGLELALQGDFQSRLLRLRLLPEPGGDG